MSASDAFKWINRRGGARSIVLLIVLLGACAFAHFMAFLRMETAHRQFVLMDERAINEMRAIDFIHTHLWIVLTYVAVFLGSLLWLECRNAPPWAVLVTFAVFALPCLGYAKACLHIGNKFIF